MEVLKIRKAVTDANNSIPQNNPYILEIQVIQVFTIALLGPVAYDARCSELGL
jgi:hypothetical protein